MKQLWSQTQVGYTPTLVVAYGGLDGEHYFYARTDVWKHPILLEVRAAADPRGARGPPRDGARGGLQRHPRARRRRTSCSSAGVPVNIGAHGQREGLAAHWEMWMLVMGGMTPLEALRAATLNRARYLGLDADIGSLEPGKLADLVVIDGDPLAGHPHSPTASTQVMVNGRLYDAATMDEVGATPRKRKPLFFERAASGYVPIATGTEASARGGCEH